MIGMLFDVAILGSSLSGLMAGALLVKRGLNVLVVDVEGRDGSIEKAGYHLRRFPGAFFGFGKGQIFSEVFTELGIPFLDKKRFTLAEPAYQVVMPDRRVDIPQDRDQLFKTLNYEFPNGSGKMMAALHELDRYSHVLRNFFMTDVVYPPTGMGESWAVRKALSNDAELMKEARESSYTDFLNAQNLQPEPRAFFDAQVQSLLPMYPDDVNLALAAFAGGLSTGGIFLLDGGVHVLESIFKERITSYRGVVHRTPSIENVEFGKFVEMKFSDQKEAVKARTVLLTGNPMDFFTEHAPKSIKSDFKKKYEMAPPATHDFVLYLGVEDNVVPVGMEPNLVLIDNPERELLGDNFIMLSLSAPGDESLAPKGKRLIAARIKVNPKGGRLESAEAQKLSAGIHAKLRDLMPFLDDFTDFVATKESFELYGRERDEGWMQAIDDDRLGVALLACKTPHKQVYYAGRAVLPALGMEGEAISARTAANLLSEKLSKK